MKSPRMHSVLAALGALALLVAPAVPAAAQTSPQQAWLTLDQAMTIGEAKLNGRVVKAKLGGGRGSAGLSELRAVLL